MDLEQTLMDLIRQEPGQTTTELHRALGGARIARPSRAKLSALLRDMSEVVDDGADPLRWHPAPKIAPASDRPPVAQARKGRKANTPKPATKVQPPEPAKPAATRKARKKDDELRQLSKRQLITIICQEIGVPDVGIARGSTEPKELFLHVSAALGLGLDPTLSKPALGEAISRRMGLPWEPDMDSRTTRSGGGDTVTARGLRQVLRAVRAAGSPAAPLEGPSPGKDTEGPTREPQPAALYGLQQAPPEPGNSTGHGGGGEGPLHAALKALIKHHSLEALGERLTYLAEDLTDLPTQRLGDEISFITGDRVDLLMQDEAGRMVVIEVEPDIDRAGHIGFHQAAKYWVLVAVANGLELGNVRRMVAARTIDPELASHYGNSYGIESVAVPMTETADGWVLARPSTDHPPPSPPRVRMPARSTARAAKKPAVDSERVKRLLRAWDQSHGKRKRVRNTSVVKAALAELGGYSDDVVLEAIVSVSRPHDLKATAEAISLRRARAATSTRAASSKRVPAKPKRSARSTRSEAPRVGRAKKATGAALGEAPLYKPLPPGQRYCPGCGLLEVNCHC